jgi:hypothetical protein
MKRGGNQSFSSPEEALKHHGVKGMHWGVRKAEVNSSRLAGNLVVPNSGSTMEYGIASMKLTGNDLTVDRMGFCPNLSRPKAFEITTGSIRSNTRSCSRRTGCRSRSSVS